MAEPTYSNAVSNTISLPQTLFCTSVSFTESDVVHPQLQQELDKTHVAYQQCLQELLAKMGTMMTTNTSLVQALEKSNLYSRELASAAQLRDEAQRGQISDLKAKLTVEKAEKSRLAAQIAAYEGFFADIAQEMQLQEQRIDIANANPINPCLQALGLPSIAHPLIRDSNYLHNRNIHQRFITLKKTDIFNT